MKTKETFKAYMLDQFENWGTKITFSKKDFVKVADYGTKKGTGIQIWKDAHNPKEYFIFKEVKE